MPRDTRPYCVGLGYNGDQCRNHILNDETKYCKLHQYMNNYTEAMIKQLTLCSGCRKYQYCEGFSTCENCRKRKADKRKEMSEQIIKCKKEGCHNNVKENGYCGKHLTERMKFEEQTKTQGFKPCANSIRGCRNQLSIDCEYSRCEQCREKECVKDHERRCFKKQITDVLTQIQVNNPPTNNIVQKPIEEPHIIKEDEIKQKLKVSFKLKDNDSKKIVIVANKVHLTSDGFYIYEGENGEGKHCTRCGHFYEKKEFVGLRGGYVNTCLIHCRSANHRGCGDGRSTPPRRPRKGGRAGAPALRRY